MKKLFFILWALVAASVLHAGPFTVKAGLSRASLVTGYADKTTLDAKAKDLQVTVTNSGYRKAGN